MNLLRNLILTLAIFTIAIAYPNVANSQSYRISSESMTNTNLNYLNTSQDGNTQSFDVPMPESMRRYTNETVSGFEKFSDNSINKQKPQDELLDFNPDDLPGLYCMISGYDFQTNGCMPERLGYYEDDNGKYMQMLWMCDPYNYDMIGSFPDRGSYYEAIDISSADELFPENWFGERIEDVRTGWPALAEKADGGIASMSHDPSDQGQLLFFSSSKFPDEDDSFADLFTQLTVTEKKRLWPRMAVDAMGYYHAIYTLDSAAADREGHFPDWVGQIVYVRSTDDGATWSDPVHLTGADAFDGDFPDGSGGDVYVITARENKIVIAYTDMDLNFMYRVSNDNGDTWSSPNVIFAPQHEMVYTEAELGDGNILFSTDTVISPGRQFDAIIDADGNAHFLFARLNTYRRGTGKIVDGELQVEGTDTLYRGTSVYFRGCYYWREGTQELKAACDIMGESQAAFGDPNNNDAVYMRISQRWGFSWANTPQLGVDDDGNVYATYSGIVNGETIDEKDTKPVSLEYSDGTINEVNGFCGHIYVTHKLAGDGYEFSVGKNVTPNGSDCQYPTMYNNVMNVDGEKKMYIGYQADGTPGDRITDPETVTGEQMTYVYIYPVPTSLLNESIASVEEEELSFDSNIDVSISPNPVNGIGEIKLNINGAAVQADITIYDLLGNPVYPIANTLLADGQVSYFFNSNKLSQGVYYLVVNAGGHKITKSISIVK